MAPNPFQFQQSFALVPEAALMFPKAYVIAGFLQDDWRIRNNLTLNLGLRYDVEIIKDIPDWPARTDKNNVDPRIGFAWDPKGDQKWSVRGGFGRFTQQYAIFTIVKGGVGGRNGQVTVSLAPTDPLFPTFPNALPAFPPGAVLPARDIQEISPDLENEHAWTGQPRIPASARTAHEPRGRRQHQPRRQARVPRHEPGAADSEGRPERGPGLESERDDPHPGAGRCDASDSGRCRTASGGWTC